MAEEKSPLPWYREGLNFKCTECGKCCTGQPGFVWITSEEIKLMAETLNLSEKVFKIRFVRNRGNRLALVEKKDGQGGKECIFLKDKKCQIYKARPQQCRTFPWWKENLNTEESWKLAASFCEGINPEAPLIPYDEIAQSLD